MRYHLRLCKALSYKGIVSATKKQPDVFVEDKATADEAVATGYFTLITDTPEQQEKQETAHLDKEQLEEWKFDDLKRLAEDMGIDTKSLKKKAELVEAIAAVEVIPGDEEDNEADYGEEG